MALWTPANLAVQPNFWFDAADASTIILDGSGVLNWGDKGTSGLDAFQTDLTKQPTLVENGLNGNSIIRFGGAQRLDFSFQRLLLSKTLILVFKTGANTAFFGDSPNRLSIRPNGVIALEILGGLTSVIGVGQNTWGIGQVGVQDQIRYYINGVASATYASTTTPFPFSYLGGGLIYYEGDLAEAIMFDDDPSDEDRQRIEGYLAHKWGITSALVPGHPYLSTAPTTNIVVTVSIPNAPDGARYRIINLDRDAEIANGVVAGGNGILTSFTAEDPSVPHVEGDTIRVDVTYPPSITAFRPDSIPGLVSTVGISGRVAKEDDPIYNHYGIDGSKLTKLQADFSQNDIEIIVPQNFSVAEIYAFYVYVLTTEDGIRNWLGAITAIDIANFMINVEVLPLLLDNQTSTNVWATNPIRIFRSDGARPVRHPTTGSGGIEVPWQGQVYIAHVTTLNDPVVTGNISEVLALVQAGMEAQGYTKTRADDIAAIKENTDPGQVAASVWEKDVGTGTAEQVLIGLPIAIEDAGLM